VADGVTGGGAHAAGGGDTPLLELRNVSKTFGRAKVLDAVALDVRAGEIHGLLGQNGSGKSTLIKILSGFHEPDPADGPELRIGGEEVKLPIRPQQFHGLGLSFVHQDLALIPSLSVTENFLAGALARSERRTIRWRTERRRAREVFDRYGLALDPAAQVAQLSGTDRALLAIVRAAEEQRDAAGSVRGTILVLDEPTAFLPRAGVELLFRLVRTLASSGAGILFVSHDLEEVLDITHRATVLFNGRVAGTVATRETSEHQLVELIVGRRLELLAPQPHSRPSANVSVAAAGISGGLLREASFDIHEGEILGVAGLAGAGFEDLPYLIFGAADDARGSVRLRGTELRLDSMTPAHAIRAGMALIPGDRATSGSIAALSVADNVTIASVVDHQRGLRLDRQGMARRAQELGRRFDVRPNDPRMNYGSLSGGNQQKVLIAKWFETRPSLLLLHEPTQGVDVGARQDIYAMLRQAARDGTAILVASTDYEQLELLCDRVIVFARGEPFRELAGEHLTKDRITAECLASATLHTTRTAPTAFEESTT
jgi:ribose transport system ATP-binding protein